MFWPGTLIRGFQKHDCFINWSRTYRDIASSYDFSNSVCRCDSYRDVIAAGNPSIHCRYKATSSTISCDARTIISLYLVTGQARQRHGARRPLVVFLLQRRFEEVFWPGFFLRTCRESLEKHYIPTAYMQDFNNFVGRTYEHLRSFLNETFSILRFQD